MVRFLAAVGPPDARQAASVTLRAYLLRCGWPAPGGKARLTSTDLLSDGVLAAELVRWMQTGYPPGRFRPVRTQFLPSATWLRELWELAGPVAGPRLDEILGILERQGGRSPSIHELLGRLSQAFEAAWVDAFAADAIPAKARGKLLAIREFPEFRAPARVALAGAFDTADGLQELVRRFAPALPLLPADLSADGLPRSLAHTGEFVTGLVAFADRCQLLHALLRTAASCGPGRDASDSCWTGWNAGSRLTKRRFTWPPALRREGEAVLQSRASPRRRGE